MRIDLFLCRASVFLLLTALSTVTVFGGPSLQLQLNGTNLVLAWPTNAMGFHAQSRFNFAQPGSWEDLNAVPVVSNSLQLIFVPRTNAYRFFRLFKESGTNPAVDALLVSTNALSFGSTATLGFDILEPDLDFAGLELIWTNVLGSFSNFISAKSLGLTEGSSHADLPLRPEKLPFGTSYFKLRLVDRAGFYSEPVFFEITIAGNGGAGTAPQLSAVTSEAAGWQPSFEANWKLKPGFILTWSDAEGDVERIRARLKMPSGDTVVRELLAGQVGFTNVAGTNTLRPFTLTYLDWPGSYVADFQLIDRTGRTSALQSVQFEFDYSAPPPLQISGFSPTSGGPGTLVNLFIANPASVGSNYQVTLAGVPCSVLTNGVTFISVLVPTGAITAPFKLTTESQAASAPFSFVVPPVITMTSDRDQAAPGEAIQFYTSVRGATNRSLTFLVNGIPGGNFTNGLISTNGLYRVPLLPPTNRITIVAALTTRPSITATALVQVLPSVSLGGTGLVTVARGGLVSTTEGDASLEVPTNALAADAFLSLAVLRGTNVPNAAPGRRLLGGVKLNPSGIIFNQPATVTIPLMESRPAGTILALKYFIRTNNTFLDEGLTATVAANGRQAVGHVSHFSEVIVDEPEVVVPSGPPQIFTLRAASTFHEGLIVPVLIMGQNLVPGLRVEILRSGQPTSDVVPSNVILETNRMGLLVTVSTLRDLNFGDLRDYELRLINSANQIISTNLLVQGLNELIIPAGVQTNFSSSSQTFSEVDIGTGAVLNTSGLGWFVNGNVRLAGRINAQGRKGGSSLDEAPGTNSFFTSFDQRGGNGGEPDQFGHDSFLQLSPRGDFSYGDGGGPGEDISSIEKFFQALLDLWSCVTGDIISCGEFVAGLVEIVGDFEDMEAGKAIGRPGMPGARATSSFSLANDGNGGGGGGGGGDLNLFDAGEGGGAGGNGGNGVFIIARGDFLLNGQVDTRGGDGGDGGTNVVTIIDGFSAIPIEDTPSANRGGGGGGGSGGDITLLARSGFQQGAFGGVDARGGNPGNSLTQIRSLSYPSRTETASRYVRLVDAKYPITPSGHVVYQGAVVPAHQLPDFVSDHGLLQLQLPPAPSAFSSTITITIRGENTNQVRQVSFPTYEGGFRRANLLFFPGFNTVYVNDGRVPDISNLYRNVLYLAGPDSDGDGLSDKDEAVVGSNPLIVDTDNDGLSDFDEVLQGLEPATADSDGDLLLDTDELSGGTDPRRRDTDGDGFWDGWELVAGSSPTHAQSTIALMPPGTLYAEVGSVSGRLLAIVDPATGKMAALGRVNGGFGFGLAISPDGTVFASRGDHLVRLWLDRPVNASGDLAVTNVGFFATNGSPIYCYSLASSTYNGNFLGIESTAPGESTGQLLQINPVNGLATRIGANRPDAMRAVTVLGSGSTQELVFASSVVTGGADALVNFPSGPTNAALSLGTLSWTNVYGLTLAGVNRLYASRSGEGESDLVLVNTTNLAMAVQTTLSTTVFDLAISPCPAPCLNGPFLSPSTYSGRKIVTADFNGDTRPDLAMAVTRTIGSDEFVGVTVLHGQGNGAFTNSTSHFFINAKGFTDPDLALADVNGDGRTDIIVMQGAVIVGFFQTLIRPAELMVLLADGQGGFLSPIISAMGGGPSQRLSRITAADWSGDGRADLIFVNQAQHAYSFQGTGSGLFTNAIDLLPTTQSIGVLLKDVNGDARPDFLSVASGLTVRLADGSGGFLTNQLFGSTSGTYLNVGDVDGDGDVDVVSTDYGAVPTVFYNGGTGLFPTNATFNPKVFPNGVYAPAALGDLSGDGRADAVVPSSGPTLTAFISSQTPALTHTMKEPATAPFFAGGTVSSVLILDVNADGLPDIVASIGNGISVMLGESAF